MVSAALGTGRRYSLSRSRGGVLLCVALMVVTAWAVLAGGWVVGGGGAVVVAVTAVLEAALLARAAVPRVVAVLVVPLLALAAIVPTTLRALPFDGDASLGHTAARYAGALFGGLATNSDWTFTVGLCAVLWLCGYWLGWVALREHRGVLAVVPLYAVLATNVLNAKSSELIGLPETFAVFLSLLVIAQVHLNSLQATWRLRSVSPLSGTRSRFAASVTVTAIALTLLALLIPPVSTADISGGLFPGPGAHGGSGNQNNASAGPGSIQFNPAVTPGGKLVSTPRQVLTYTTDGSIQTYLRVVNDTVFAGGNWQPRNPATLPSNPSNLFDAQEFTAGPLPRDRNPTDGGVGKSEQAITATISMDPSATGKSGLVIFPGEPDAVDQDGRALGEPTADRQALLTVDAVQVDAVTNTSSVYASTGLVSTATAAQLQRAGTNYPDFVSPETVLTEDFTGGAATITALAKQWTAGTTNTYDAATAIETHLRDPKSFTYTLNPPPVPAGQWPIVYFLVTGHRGYCQYFASSMGAMLRSLGIPTRLVVGYGPGTPLEEAPRQGVGRIAVSTSDAHAWVESYFPGYGWISFEPTPPSHEGAYVPFPRGGDTPTPITSSPTPQPSTPTPAPNNIAPTNPSNGTGHGIPGALMGLILGAGGVLLLASVVLLWLLSPRSLPGAWRRLEALGAWAGVRRRPSETYREYAERLAVSRPRGTAPLAAIAVALGRAVYSKEGAGGSDPKVLRGWRKLVFALARSRKVRLRRSGGAVNSSS